MRTGIMIAGAISVAACGTAMLMGFGVIGAGSRKPAEVAAAPSSSTQAPVRQVQTIPIQPQSAPVAPIAAPTPAPAPVIAAPQPAPVVPAAPWTPPKPAAAPSRPAPSDVTASIGNTKQLFVTGSRVALRDNPDAKAKLIERMPTGQKLAELSRDGDWVRVRHPKSGAEGWVSGEFVDAKAPARN